jgi:hypothetical protein
MEPEDSVPYPQEPTTGPCPEPHKSSPKLSNSISLLSISLAHLLSFKNWKEFSAVTLLSHLRVFLRASPKMFSFPTRPVSY